MKKIQTALKYLISKQKSSAPKSGRHSDPFVLRECGVRRFHVRLRREEQAPDEQARSVDASPGSARGCGVRTANGDDRLTILTD